jgi:hypothetical protein
LIFPVDLKLFLEEQRLEGVDAYKYKREHEVMGEATDVIPSADSLIKCDFLPTGLHFYLYYKNINICLFPDHFFGFKRISRALIFTEA